jgi:hypothetical protein
MAETKPTEAKPDGGKSVETKSTETKSTDKKVETKSKPIKRTDTQLTLDALKNCIADQELIVSETYPFIILFILFYITTSRAYFLTSESKKIPCQENIRRGEYDDFISGFVYWIISFCILIFIKFNGINFINKFVIPKSGNDFVVKTVEVGEKAIKELTEWGRAKYVGQTLLTGFTSVLNIYFVIILLLTLYYIIDKTVNLIECKSEVCTKYKLCEDKGEPSKARYYNSTDGKCYDSDFNDIKETGDGSNKGDPTFDLMGKNLGHSSRGDPNKGRLYSDFYPRWIGAVIQTNTWVYGFFPISIITVCTLLYIFAWTEDWAKYSINGLIFIYLFSNFIIVINGLNKTGDIKGESKIIDNIGFKSDERKCDDKCDNDEDCYDPDYPDKCPKCENNKCVPIPSPPPAA